MINKLIIFIRNPELGKVKTRLAKSIGDNKALEVYRLLLLKTRSVVLNVSARRFLFYSDQVNLSDDWDSVYFEKQLQLNGDLGAKMKAAFNTAFEQESSKVIIIGSDCYDLSEEIINRAFESLEEFDAVIGPANDGGYYLLGMNTFLPEVFDGIEWSTSSVFAKTVGRFKSLNRTVSVLPELVDIDEFSDLEASSFDISKLNLVNSKI